MMNSQEIAYAVVAIAEEKKAFNPIILNLVPENTFTDFFVILSAQNSRQVVSIADEIVKTLKTDLALPPQNRSGIDSGTWVLLDYGFMYVHIFQEPTREYYHLEGVWKEAEVLPINEEIIKIHQQLLIENKCIA